MALESLAVFFMDGAGETAANDGADELVSDLTELISIFLSPVPTLTTCARACVAVLALLRKVEPTLKALAPLLGRVVYFSKLMLGRGGVLLLSVLLFPTDLTLTTVGFARMPVCAGARTWACLP